MLRQKRTDSRCLATKQNKKKNHTSEVSGKHLNYSLNIFSSCTVRPQVERLPAVARSSLLSGLSHLCLPILYLDPHLDLRFRRTGLIQILCCPRPCLAPLIVSSDSSRRRAASLCRSSARTPDARCIGSSSKGGRGCSPQGFSGNISTPYSSACKSRFTTLQKKISFGHSSKNLPLAKMGGGD